MRTINQLLQQHYQLSADIILEHREHGKPRVPGFQSWGIDEKYFLKSFPVSLRDEKQKELQLLSALQEIGVPALLPIENKIIVEDDLLFQLFPYMQNVDQELFGSDVYIARTAQRGAAFAQIESAPASVFQYCLREAAYLCIEPRVIQAIRPLLNDAPGIGVRDLAERTYRALSFSLFPFLPYLEKRFSHGDLHPDNFLRDGTEMVIADWEHAGRREAGYDLAFFIGCVGMRQPEALREKSVQDLISAYLRNGSCTLLSFEKLPELTLATRVLWASVWDKTADEEMLHFETAYWKFWLDNMESIRSQWRSAVTHAFTYSSYRWAVQDAMRPEAIADANRRLQEANVLAPQCDLESIVSPEPFATMLRVAAIAKGTEEKISDVIRILLRLKSLSVIYSRNTHIVSEFALALGNAALDFSKFRQQEGMDMLLRESEHLLRQRPESEAVQIGMAGVLRNASILFAETQDLDAATKLIQRLITLAASHSENLAVQEECARALTNGIASLLPHRVEAKTETLLQDYAQKLEVLQGNHPESKKITGAVQVSRANAKKIETSPNTPTTHHSPRFFSSSDMLQ